MTIFLIIFIMLTIILLSGKGSFLVAGYNTLSKEEKLKFDKKAVSREAGWVMLLIDIAVVMLFYLDYQDKMKDSYAIIAAIYMVCVVFAFMFFGSKKNK